MNRLSQLDAEWEAYRRWMHKVITIYIFETERPLILTQAVKRKSQEMFANREQPGDAVFRLIFWIDAPF